MAIRLQSSIVWQNRRRQRRCLRQGLRQPEASSPRRDKVTNRCGPLLPQQRLVVASPRMGCVIGQTLSIVITLVGIVERHPSRPFPGIAGPLRRRAAPPALRPHFPHLTSLHEINMRCALWRTWRSPFATEWLRRGVPALPSRAAHPQMRCPSVRPALASYDQQRPPSVSSVIVHRTKARYACRRFSPFALGEEALGRCILCERRSCNTVAAKRESGWGVREYQWRVKC